MRKTNNKLKKHENNKCFMVLEGFQNYDTKILGVSIILSDPYMLDSTVINKKWCLLK